MPPSSTPPSIAGADWLEWPETKQVFGALTASGDEVRAVGGAVRDSLLGRRVREVDMATTAAPETVMELAGACDLKTVATGISHGTVTVLAGDHNFEVTTLRRDVETYGRHAKVAYTDDWEADASRRDFTINALYADPTGKVYDPLGAMEDVEARRIRFIGDARERVREDYLRILRFFRFHAELDLDAYDATGLLACATERGGLDGLSAERVSMEMLRMLCAPGAMNAVSAMFDHGLLVTIIGGVPQLDRFARLLDIKMQFEVEPDAVLRLAALALWVREDAARLFHRFRLSTADRAKLEAAAEFCGIVADNHGDGILWGLYRRGRDDFLSAALLAWAASGASGGDPDWRGMIARIASEAAPEFPLAGADIVSLGVPEGPAVGELLKAIEVQWMSDGFQASREELLAFATTLRSGNPE